MVYYIRKVGERAAGIFSNRKASFNAETQKRIPDKLIEKSCYLEEVKNVRRLSYTKQLQDYVKFVEKHKFKMALRIRSNTILSEPLQQLVREGKIIIKKLPW